MVVGRKELSVILLAAVALVFYLVLLSTTSSNAQTNGGITIDGESSIIEDIIVDEEITVQEDVIVEEPTTQRQPQKRQSQNEPTIIKIPNKPLPPTGGLPVYGTVAGFIVVGAGLFGLGVGIRRGQRR